MERVAFRMKLKPGSVGEYKTRHDLIWPELSDAFGRAGIHDYSIFLDEETLALFAVQKRDDPSLPLELSRSELMKKWWHHMEDLMETNGDGSPVRRDLEEVFHLD
jgi:L-rhamnose mutarotase